MKKQMTSFILLALIALAGCTKMEEWESNAVKGNYTLNASIESNGPSLSRTVVNDGGQVLWTQNDSIGVFGDKGSVNAPFELAAGMGHTSGSFKGDLPEGEEADVAYYPYGADADLNGQTLTFSLPAEYVYTGKSNAPMLGVRGEDGNFSFKHLAGLLKIVIHGAPEEATKFVVTSEGEEAAGLTGMAQVDDITAEEPVLRLVGNVGKTVTYILPDEVEGELYFYVPIPVGTYGKLSVSLLKEDGTPYWTKTISNREVRRAVMVDMPVLYHVTPDYVDVDWNNVTVTSDGMDATKFTLQFENDVVPQFVSGQSIVVVPCNNSLYLRRVMGSEVNGNKVDLTTIPAGMTELFRNTEFSLALTPDNENKSSNTRSSASSGNVYYPIRIVGWNADGTCTTLYDKELATRAEAEAKDTIHLYDLDLSGLEIDQTEDEVLTLSLKSFKEKVDLTANAYFKFGEAIDEKEIDEDLRVRISDLEACRFSLGASALLEIIPQIEAHGEYELKVEERSLIPTPVSYTFFFMAGGVPVAVALSCDLLADFTLNGEATVNVSGGVTLEGSFEAGMQYNKEPDEWEPLANASFDYEVHPLEVTGDAEINMRATAYPKMEVKLYDFIGPTFAPKPVLEDTIKAGFYGQYGSSEEDYFGWTQQAYSALELHSSVELDFLGLWKPKVDLPVVTVGKSLIHNAPDDIELVSPQNGQTASLEGPMEVTFNVTQKFVNTPQPLSGVVVKFESETGDVENTYAISDLEGNVTVKWTPRRFPSSLQARIYDSEGEVISEAEFTTKFPLVGRWWFNRTAYLPQFTPNPDLVDSENYLEFSEDGTFEECYNPNKNLYGQPSGYPEDWDYDEEDVCYSHEIEWRLRKGTYDISDDGVVTTHTTFYHETRQSWYYNVFNQLLPDWSNGILYETKEIPEKELISGKIWASNINTIMFIDSDGNASTTYFRIIEEDGEPELLNTPAQ